MSQHLKTYFWLILFTALLFNVPQAAAQLNSFDTRMVLEGFSCDPATDKGIIEFWIQFQSITPETEQSNIFSWQNSIRLDDQLANNFTNITWSESYFPIGTGNGTYGIDFIPDPIPATGPPYNNVWLQILVSHNGGTFTTTPAHNDWFNVLKVTVEYENLSSLVGARTTVDWFPDPIPPTFRIRNDNSDVLQNQELGFPTDIPLACVGEYGSVGQLEAYYLYDSGVHIGSAVDEETEADDAFPETDCSDITIGNPRVGETATVDVPHTLPSGENGYLQGWIDWDGTQDPLTMTPIWSSPQLVSGSGTLSGSFSVPSSATPNSSYWVRYRLVHSSDPLDASEPDGSVYFAGEIQDCQVTLEGDGPSFDQDTDFIKDDGIDLGTGGVNPGGIFTYTLELHNSGDMAAYNVDVQDVLPAGLSLATGDPNADITISATHSPNTASVSGQQIDFLLAQIDAGETVTITIDVVTADPWTGPYPYQIENQAEIQDYTDNGGTSYQITPVLSDDPDQPGNEDPTITNLNAAPDFDPELDGFLKTDTPANGSPAAPGDVIDYSITIQNVGDANAYDVVITDEIPAHTQFSGNTGDIVLAPTTGASVSYDNATGEFTVNIDQIDADPASAIHLFTITFPVTVQDPFAADVKQVSNQAFIEGYDGFSGSFIGSHDPDVTWTGTPAPTVTPVEGTPDFGGINGFIKDDGVDATGSGVPEGGTFSYVITITNTGDITAFNVEASDLLPEYTSINGSISILPAGTGGSATSSVDPGTGQTLVDMSFPYVYPQVPITVTIPIQLDASIPAGVTEISNQAVLESYDSVPNENRPSDDEETGGDPNDPQPTVTPLDNGDGPSFDLDTDFIKDDGIDLGTGGVNPGGIFTYTLELHNSGDMAAYNVDVQDVLPAGLSLATGDPNADITISATHSPNTASVSGQQIDFLLAQIDAGETVTITIDVVTADPWTGPYPYQIENQAEIQDYTDNGGTSYQITPVLSDDPDQPGNEDPTITNLNAAPDFDPELDGFLKTDTPANGSPAAPGDVIDYSITIQNVGDANAYDVVITDEIPAHTQFSGNTGDIVLAPTTGASVSYDNATGEFTVNIDQIDADPASAIHLFTITFPVTVQDPFAADVKQVSNQAFIEGYDGFSGSFIGSHDPDVTWTGTPAPTVTPVEGTPDFGGINGFIKDDGVDATGSGVPEGGTFSYVITITNTGDITAFNVEASDLLPEYTSINGSISILPAGTGGSATSSVDPGTGQTLVDMSFPYVYPQVPITVTIPIQLDASIPAGVTEISNQAVLESYDSVPNENRPSDDEETGGDPNDPQPTVTPISQTDVPNIEVEKTVSPDATFSDGETGTFTLTVTNTSTSTTMNNVSIQDTWPAGTPGLTFVSVQSIDQGTYDDTQSPHEWTIGTLTAGQSVSVTLEFTASAGTQSAQVTNEACLDVNSVTPADENSADDCASVDVTIEPAQVDADIQVTKQFSAGSITQGDQGTFTLVAENLGTESVSNIVIRDTWPAELTYISHSPATESFTPDGTDYLWEIPSLAGDASITLTVTYEATGQSGVTVTNEACYESSTPTDPDPSCSSDDVTITPPGCPDEYVDTELVLVDHRIDDPVVGRNTLVLGVEAMTRNGMSINCGIYDPTILVPAVIATLNPAVTFPTNAFASNGNYTAQPAPSYDATLNQITFGYQYSGTGSYLVMDGTVQTLLEIQIEYDPIQESACFSWDPQDYFVQDENGCDLTGDLTAAEDVCVTFPIELSSFSAAVEGSSVVLEWVTQSESENLGFLIFRSEQADGQYERITKEMIDGAGNSQSANHYHYVDNSVNIASSYYYKLADVDYEGHMTLHGPVGVTVARPSEFSLEQNYPNPFNPSTNIQFHLDQAGYCELAVFNLKGQQVRTLLTGPMNAGTHSVIWDGRDDAGNLMPSGVYLYKLQLDDRVEIRKMEFLK